MDQAFRDRLAHKVRYLRGEQTQNEFASSLKISQSTVRAWENSENVPNLENLEKLAQLANEQPEELLAHLYGRQIATKPLPSLEEQIQELSVKKLVTLMAFVVSLLAGSLAVIETADVRAQQEQVILEEVKSSKI